MILTSDLMLFEMNHQQYPVSNSSRYINDATIYAEFYYAKGLGTNFMFHQSGLASKTSVVFQNINYPVEYFKGDVSLLKPMGILKKFPVDRFDPNKNGFRYFSDGKEFYILVSNGPDEDIDIDERIYKGDLSPFQNMIFDISNGIDSNGDIIVTDKKNRLNLPNFDMPLKPTSTLPPIGDKSIKDVLDAINENQHGGN